MTLRVANLKVLFLFILVNPFFVQAQEQTQPLPSSHIITSSVNRINVGVAVTDSHGDSAKGLKREDFKLFDNGREQPITNFASNEEQGQVVFLVEDSMAGNLLGRLGKSPFLATLNLLGNVSVVDRVAIVTFSDSPRLMLDFTPDKLAARQTLEQYIEEGLKSRVTVGSTLSNISWSLAATLDWLVSVPGGKIIVLLSAGIDTSPSETLEAIRKKLRTSDVQILSVSLLGDLRKPGKNAKHYLVKADRDDLKQGITQADELLRSVSEISGGHAYFPMNAQELDRDSAEIAQLICSQYELAFAPSVMDGQLHKIKVKVKRFRYSAHYRPAYLALPVQ